MKGVFMFLFVWFLYLILDYFEKFLWNKCEKLIFNVYNLWLLIEVKLYYIFELLLNINSDFCGICDV